MCLFRWGSDARWCNFVCSSKLSFCHKNVKYRSPLICLVPINAIKSKEPKPLPQMSLNLPFVYLRRDRTSHPKQNCRSYQIIHKTISPILWNKAYLNQLLILICFFLYGRGLGQIHLTLLLTKSHRIPFVHVYQRPTSHKCHHHHHHYITSLLSGRINVIVRASFGYLYLNQPSVYMSS